MFTYNINSRLQKLNEGWFGVMSILLCVIPLMTALKCAVAEGEVAVVLIITISFFLNYFSVSMGIKAVTFLEWDVGERRKKERFESAYMSLARITSVAMALNIYGLYSNGLTTPGIIFYGVSLGISSLWYFNVHTLCGEDLSVGWIQMKPRNWHDTHGIVGHYPHKEVIESDEMCWSIHDEENPRGKRYLLFTERVRGVEVRYVQEM